MDNIKNKRLSDQIVVEFTSHLKKRLGGQLEQTILFGSRARGDFSVNSDYDFLIIVDKKENKQKKIVSNLCYYFLDKYNVLISFLLYDKQEWQRKQRFPIGLNILREGIRI
jgi:predicted nucleotidyltransferase